MCDDLFDEFGDEKFIQELAWKKTTNEVKKDGYRSGIESGQEEKLQEGFNSTYNISSKLLYIVSALRGQISGKLSYNLMKPNTYGVQQINDLELLLTDFLQFETELLSFSSDCYNEIKTNQDELEKLMTDIVSSWLGSGESLDYSWLKSNSGDISVNLKSTTSESTIIKSQSDNFGQENDHTKCTGTSSVFIKLINFQQRLSEILKSGS